jgi:hypothetical protein
MKSFNQHLDTIMKATCGQDSHTLQRDNEFAHRLAQLDKEIAVSKVKRNELYFKWITYRQKAILSSLSSLKKEFTAAYQQAIQSHMKQLVETTVRYYDQTNERKAPVRHLERQLVKFARAYANYLQQEIRKFKIAAENENPKGDKAQFMKTLNEEIAKEKQQLLNSGEVDDGNCLTLTLKSIQNRKIAEHLGLYRDSYGYTFIGHMKNVSASIQMSCEMTKTKRIIPVNQGENALVNPSDYRMIANTFKKVIDNLDNPSDVETKKNPKVIGTYLPMIEGNCLDEFLFAAQLDDSQDDRLDDQLDEERSENCNQEREVYSYGAYGLRRR